MLGRLRRSTQATRSLEATDCDLFLTVGTSALVHPAASLLHEAKKRGAFTAEVNLESTPASGMVDLSLHGPAERLLVEVEDARRRDGPVSFLRTDSDRL